MGGPGAGGVINTLRIRRVAQRLGQGAANYSDALSQNHSDSGGAGTPVENAPPAEIPQGLIGQLFEINADYAEALWALDQPPGSLNTAT